MKETIKKEKMLAYTVKTNSYVIRETTLDGKPHLVVPVIMMVEGVHNGSHGPILHQEAELSQSLHAWNGIPVTISHPTEDGENVTANTPQQLDKDSVGRVFNAHYENGLKADVWIDVTKIEERSPLALTYIRQSRPLEVSVGVFNDTVFTEGEWNGETYEAIASNYKPDHLALLPGERGACSWSDGCGIRANAEGGDMPEMDLLKTFKELNQKGYVVRPVTNEQGYRETTSLLQSKLDAMDTSERVYYLQEVYADHFIYEVRDRELGGTTLYKRDYSLNANEVVIGESPVEVHRKVDYVTMKAGVRTTSINNDNEGGKMSKDSAPCCEAKVDALIANKGTQWTAGDREWLLTQEEGTIDKMSPKEVEKPASIEVNAEEVITTFKATLTKIEDYTELMPEAMKVEVSGGVKLYNEHRTELVKSILDNTKDIWVEATLIAMDDATLEGVSKSIKSPVDYSGQGPVGGGTPGEETEEKLLPPGMTYKKKEDK